MQELEQRRNGNFDALSTTNAGKMDDLLWMQGQGGILIRMDKEEALNLIRSGTTCAHVIMKVWQGIVDCCRVLSQSWA